MQVRGQVSFLLLFSVYDVKCNEKNGLTEVLHSLVALFGQLETSSVSINSTSKIALPSTSTTAFLSIMSGQQTIDVTISLPANVFYSHQNVEHDQHYDLEAITMNAVIDATRELPVYFKVYIGTGLGKLSLLVAPDWTVSRLWEELKQIYGRWQHGQLLSFAGVKLDDDTILHDVR